MEVRVIGWALASVAAVAGGALPAADAGDPDAPAPPELDLGAPSAVVGGDPAPVGVWDDAVALYTAEDQFACSGVLVAPDLVLTAGHCGANLGRVVVGTTSLAQGGEQIGIARVVVHPDHYTTFDAALVVLEHPVAGIAPREMALDCIAEDYVVEGAPVVIVGFGALDEWANDWSTELRQGFTNVTDPVCSDLSAGCYAQVSPGGELVAGGNGVDSCAGDSGGPLYLPTPDDGVYLVGITSRARVPAETPCGGGGIYVRVDALVPWIEAESGRTLSRPACVGRNRVPALSVEPIEVVRGSTTVAVIEVSDPDTAQHHTFEIVGDPVHGAAMLDPAGAVYYLAPDVFVGDDAIVVEVTDDGEPPRSAEITVPVRILPVERGPGLSPGGCASAPTHAGALGLLGLLGLLRRRRRTAG